MKKNTPIVLIFLVFCWLLMPLPTKAQNCSAAGAQTAPAGSSVTTASTLKVYNSTEAGPNSAAARSAVNLQDDAWRAGALGDAIGNNFITFSNTGAQNLSAPLAHSFMISSITISYDFRDFPTNYRSISYPCIGDIIADTSLRRTFLSKHDDMQTSPTTGVSNEAPRPASLHIPANHPLIYDEIDQPGRDSTINAALFTFSSPVKGFGAWFGDVETRTDGNDDGVPVTVRFLDTSGNRIGNDILIQPRAVQSTCGDDDDGCGNHQTRWIGFTDTNATARVKQMILIIGYQGGSGSPDSQRFSFIGPTLPVTTLAAPGIIGGRVTTAGGTGIRNARVTLLNLTSGEERSTITSSLGYYEFADTPVAEAYMVSVSAKGLVFNPQVFTLFDVLDNVDFTPIEGRFLDIEPQFKIDELLFKNNIRNVKPDEKSLRLFQDF